MRTGNESEEKEVEVKEKLKHNVRSKGRHSEAEENKDKWDKWSKRDIKKRGMRNRKKVKQVRHIGAEEA